MPVVCFIGLGSNLGNSRQYLKNALTTLNQHPDISDLSYSCLYRSKPHGPKNQPDYLNAVARIKTQLGSYELLDLLQAIENSNQRNREGVEHWGARTLDLDLLLYGKERIKTKRLTVPHPYLCERAFVLLPMMDILITLGLRDLKISKKTSLKQCIDELSTSEIKDIEKITDEFPIDE